MCWKKKEKEEKDDFGLLFIVLIFIGAIVWCASLVDRAVGGGQKKIR